MNTFFSRMQKFFPSWRTVLASMLTPPWNHVIYGYSEDRTPNYAGKVFQLLYWIYGWLLSFAGIIGTGIFMPYFVRAWHVPVAWQNWVVIFGALLGGFLWQVAGLLLYQVFQFLSLQLFAVGFRAFFRRPNQAQNLTALYAFLDKYTKAVESGDKDLTDEGGKEFVTKWLWLLVIALIVPLLSGILSLLCPLIVSGLLIYWYFSHFAPQHDLTGTGIIGATLLKLAIAFGFPFIQGVVRGQIFAWVFRKIRNEEPPTPKGKPLPVPVADSVDGTATP